MFKHGDVKGARVSDAVEARQMLRRLIFEAKEALAQRTLLGVAPLLRVLRHAQLQLGFEERRERSLERRKDRCCE